MTTKVMKARRAALAGLAALGMAVTAATSPAVGQEVGTTVPATVTHHSGYVTSTDRWHTRLFHRDDTVAQARGAVVIVHGLGEQQDRYDYLSGRLNAAGYSTYRFDQRGHGRSAAPYVANVIPRAATDDWFSTVDDIAQFVEQARAENPGRPVFLLGHSMGAVAVQTYGVKYPGTVRGIVSNAGGIPVNPWGRDTEGAEEITPEGLTQAEKDAPQQVSDYLPLDQLTSWNSLLLRQARTSPSTLRLPSPMVSWPLTVPFVLPPVGVCSDPQVIADMQANPLNNKRVGLSQAKQGVVGITYNILNAPSFTTPTLVMHGQKDGVNPSYLDVNWYNAIGSTDKRLVVWQGLQHEVFNEPVKDQPIDLVIGWMDDRAR